MAEEKTMIFQSDATNTMLSSLLAQRSVDPSLIAMMNNGGFGGQNGIWLLFLIILMGGGNWGNRGDGFLASQINNNTGRDMLLNAINGNKADIAGLAQSLNVSNTAVQGAINQLTLQAQSIGSQVGLSGQQTINAIQAGNAQLASQLASNACAIEQMVNNQGYENRIENMQQTNILGSKIDAQSQMIADKFAALEMRELQNKLDAERTENATLKATISNYNQNATIHSMINGATAPINMALGITPYATGLIPNSYWG